MEFQEKKSESTNFKKILWSFLSKWYLFVLFIGLSVLIAKFYLRYQPNIYKVKSTIILKDDDKSIRTLGGLDVFNKSRNIQDDIYLLKSSEVITRVVEELPDFRISYFHKGNIKTVEFYPESPFKVILDTSHVQGVNISFTFQKTGSNTYRIIGRGNNIALYDLSLNKDRKTVSQVSINKELKFGEKYEDENFSFKILLQNPYFENAEGMYYYTINSTENIVNQYKNKLQILPISKESSILMVSAMGPSAAKDVDFLNKYCEVVVRLNLEEKNAIVSNTIRFIDDQIKSISESLVDVEKEIKEFRSTNKVPDLANSYGLAYERLQLLTEEKAELMLKTQYYQYVLNYIKENKDLKDLVAPSSIGIEDEILNGIIAELISYRTERMLLSERSSSKNPYVKDLDKKIENTTNMLFENVKSILEVSQIPIRDIDKKIADLESKLESLPEQDRLWLDIERRFNLNNHLYNFLLEKKAEAGITKASTKADRQLVDPAVVNEAILVSPDSSSIYNVATFIGIALSVALILLLEFLNDKISNIEDLENKTQIPILGIVGHNDQKSNLAVSESPKSTIAESFRSIRTNLNYLAPEKKNKVIVVTSSIGGEGKTFFSINLSNILAISDKKVILIGADLRKPKIFDDFHLANDKGLSTYLSGITSLEETIIKTNIDNFELLTAGPNPTNPAVLLNSANMKHLIAASRFQYASVNKDTSPICLVCDGFSLIQNSDINLYIVRFGYTRFRLLQFVNNLFIQKKISNLNMVVNDFKVKGNSYYGYNYGYGESYGYGDSDSVSNKNSIANKCKSFIVGKFSNK